MKLIPIKRLRNEEINEVILSSDLDINHFFKRASVFCPYVYMHKTVYFEFAEISKDYFWTFKVKENILATIKAHEECIKENNFKYLFMLIHKPLRLNLYKVLFNEIPDKDKYEIFIDIYRNSEFGFNTITQKFIKEIYKYRKKSKFLFLKNVITIYRGEGTLSTPLNKAYSWSTNIEIAKFFATRYFDDGIIYQGQVKTKDILEYIDRGEFEVLTFPKNVFNIKKLNSFDINTKYYENDTQYAILDN